MCYVNIQALSKRECEQQEAIWELLETEVKYIRNVTVIINVSHPIPINHASVRQKISKIRRLEFMKICELTYSIG